MENKIPRRPEKPGERKQQNEAIDFAVELLTAILKDGYNLISSYRLADCLMDIATVKRRLCHEGLSFATLTLPKFISDLFSLIEFGDAQFLGFSKKHGTPQFLRGLTNCIVNGGEEDYKALHTCYCLCVAFKKLKGEYPSSVERENLAAFVETDEQIGKICFTTPILKPIVETARRYITTLFDGVGLDSDLLRPRPGPGATNTPREHHMRYEPHVIYDQLNDVFEACEWFYAHPWDVVEQARKYMALVKNTKPYPTSRFKFVHKYVGKPRGICIEENETQWLQQALKRLLYNRIENHPMTKGRVNFASQEVNRTLAFYSSIDRSLATIDMSEASDRISRTLVHMLFCDTELLDALDAVSTRVITFPKEHGFTDLLCNKYAPMGSGVCFPVMALVHWALIRSIIHHTVIGGAHYRSTLKRSIYVYGDDILLPSEVAENVIAWLSLFGMKLNRNKSFISSGFRESCGIHAYKGKDVTPVYVNHALTLTRKKSNKSYKRLHVAQIYSTIAKEYAYHKLNMRNSAAILRRRLEAITGQLPYSSPSSPILSWKRDEVTFEEQQIMKFSKVRWDVDTQAHEYLVRVFVARKSDDHRVDDMRGYLRWLVNPPKMPVGEVAESKRFLSVSSLFRGRDEDICLKRRWVRRPALG